MHGEGLRELEEVSLRDAERRDAVFEMTGEVHVGEQGAHRPRRLPMPSLQVFRRDRDTDVLGDRQVGEERRMLMDDRDAEVLRDRGCQGTYRRTFEEDRSLVWCSRA